MAALVHCALLPSTISSFTIIIGARKMDRDAILFARHRIVHCAHGLWPRHFGHHISSELELEASIRALCMVNASILVQYCTMMTIDDLWVFICVHLT